MKKILALLLVTLCISQVFALHKPMKETNSVVKLLQEHKVTTGLWAACLCAFAVKHVSKLFISEEDKELLNKIDGACNDMINPLAMIRGDWTKSRAYLAEQLQGGTKQKVLAVALGAEKVLRILAVVSTIVAGCQIVAEERCAKQKLGRVKGSANNAKKSEEADNNRLDNRLCDGKREREDFFKQQYVFALKLSRAVNKLIVPHNQIINFGRNCSCEAQAAAKKFSQDHKSDIEGLIKQIDTHLEDINQKYTFDDNHRKGFELAVRSNLDSNRHCLDCMLGEVKS